MFIFETRTHLLTKVQPYLFPFGGQCFGIIILFQCELRKCSIKRIHSCGQMDEKFNANVNHMLSKTYAAEGECF